MAPSTVKALAPPSDAKVNKHDPNYIRVFLQKVQTLVVPSESVTKNMKFKVLVSLFHLPTGLPFGNVWNSTVLKPTQEKDSFMLKIEEPIYFYTNCALGEVCLLVEVIKYGTGQVIENNISCGWAVIRLELVSDTEADLQNPLYFGSARSLASLGKNFPNGLQEISASDLYFSTCLHEDLSRVEKFMNENLIVGRQTHIPGVEKIPGKSDFLFAPRPSKTLTVYGKDLEIKFNKNFQKISEEIAEKAVKDMLSEIRQYTEPGFFDTLLESFIDTQEESIKVKESGEVTEWKLKCYAHNGLAVITDFKTFPLKVQKTTKKEQSLTLKEFSVPGVVDSENCMIVFQLIATVKFPDKLLEKKKQVQPKTDGADFQDTSSSKIIHVKQWKFADKQPTEGIVELEGDALESVGDYKFIFQTPAKIKLTFGYSKGAKKDVPGQIKEKDEADAGIEDEEESEVPLISTVRSDQLSETHIEEQIDFREEEMWKSTPRIRTTSARSPRFREDYGDRYGGSVTAEDIKEIPHVVPQAPVVALSGLLDKKPLKLSRKSYAEILSAGFPQVKDDYGNIPTIIGSDEIVKFALNKEKDDPLACNEILVHFLAFSKSTTGLKYKQIETVFFTYQFYKFPQTTTQRLKLTEKSSLTEEAFKPFILQKINQNDEVSNEPPGAIYKYYLDPTSLRAGEQDALFKYLATQKIVIDAWNGDSMMHLGSCAVDLKTMLRQGRPATQTSFEYELTLPEHNPEFSAMTGDLSKTGRVRSTNQTVVTGHLHLRLTNVGHALRTKKGWNQTGLLSKTGTIVREQKDQNGVISVKKQAARLPDVDVNLNRMLMSEKENLRMTMGSLPEDKERKLLRMRQMRNSMLANTDNESSKLAKLESMTVQKSEREEKFQELRLIEQYRSATKEDLIQSMLLSDITVDHAINVSFGVAELIEFQFRNPVKEDAFYFIHITDPYLKPVTDNQELRMLKMYSNSPTASADIFTDPTNQNTESGITQIFLKGYEVVYIPFKYTSLQADNSAPLVTPALGSSFDSTLSDAKGESHVTKVTIKDKTEKPISILALSVHQQPILVDQTFRFSHSEKTVIRKAIRLPPFSSADKNVAFKVLCSDLNTICTTSGGKNMNQPQDVFIKTSTGPSPSTKKFYVAVYEGEYAVSPTQTWLFYIEALKRIDVQCTAGQASRFSLILKSQGASRLVKVFVSDPAEMEVDPKEAFILSSASLVEVELLVKLLKPGSRQLFVKVVDTEYHQTVYSWLISVTCSLPQITKAFEIKLPVGGGKGSVKKIPFTNNYPIRKRFLTHTDRNDLLHVGESDFVLESGEQKMIGLNFVPVGEKGATEILLYINDEHSNNEDTYCIKAVYL